MDDVGTEDAQNVARVTRLLTRQNKADLVVHKITTRRVTLIGQKRTHAKKGWKSNDDGGQWMTELVRAAENIPSGKNG